MFRRSTSKLLKTLFSALHAAAIVSVAGHSFGLPRSGESVGKPILFENKVQSIFAKRCASCHNSTPSAGFSVASLGLVLEGGRSGRAVVPGSTAESLLFKLISTGKMPPAPAKLTPLEIKTIGDWIMSGAKGNGSRAGHWAFQPPIAATPPAIPNVKNPIDRFLLAGLKRAGLTYSPPADKRTLIRRVSLDLIGLPPTREEVEGFLADKSPEAYERVVDRLLADPRYGENWARHWLDSAGYADSEGVLEEDKIRPNAWRYRDYVIRSLNSDIPYDRFLREQIAGDEMFDYKNGPKWTPEIEAAITATGFLRTAVDATRDDFNTHQFTEYQYRMLHDTQTILVSTTLGVTLQCARCHDHKYEPFTQKDYYSLQAILNGAIRPEGALLPTNRRQIIAGTTADQTVAKETNARIDAQIKALDQRSAELLAQYKALWIDKKIATVLEADRQALLDASRLAVAKQSPAQKALIVKYKDVVAPATLAILKEFPAFAADMEKIKSEREAAEKGRITLAEIRAIYDQDTTPPDTHILIRGENSQHGEKVSPGIPAVLADPLRKFSVNPVVGSTGRRLALANWITSPSNPLTARVEVNRAWAHHFGKGIVPTVENLGKSGAQPSNQTLLDWLAVAFARGVDGAKPWSRKALHRMIVTSMAYQQGSVKSARAYRIDPENKLVWRQNSRRLEGEIIRDNVLFASGTLDGKMFGEPVGEDIRPSGEVTVVGEDKAGRRSIYLLVRRSRPVTLLTTFDTPIMETNCTRRTVSTTPAQSLALMNGSFIAAQSQRMAERIQKESGTSSPVISAYQLAYQRLPNANEQKRSEQFLREQQEVYLRAGKQKAITETSALADLCLTLLSSDEFIYVD